MTEYIKKEDVIKVIAENTARMMGVPIEANYGVGMAWLRDCETIEVSENES